MRNRPLCIFCLMIFLVLCVVTVWGKGRFVKELRPSETETNCVDGAGVQVTGEVCEKTYQKNYQIIFLKEAIVTFQQHSLKESQIIIYDKNKKTLKIGEELTASGQIQFFERAANPGNFDQKFYYQKQDIHCFVWAKRLRVNPDRTPSFFQKIREKLWKFRYAGKETFCSVMGEKNGNTMAAILLGEKSQMEPGVKELYQANGIGHILAISGLHLSLIGGLTYRCLRRISGSFPAGATAGICFLGVYVLMIGFTVSVVRAGIMFLFRVGADVTGRNYDSLTALSFSAVAVLLWRPMSVFDSAFWMSFGAVFSIILVLPAFRNLPFPLLFTSVSVQLVLLPVLLVSFFEYPLYSVFLNMAVIPLLPLLLLSGIFGGLLFTVFPAAGGLILEGAGKLLDGCELLCDTVLKFPCARIVTGQPEYWQTVIYYILLFLAACLWRVKKTQKKVRRRTAAGLVLGTGIFIMFFCFPNADIAEITMLNVGQGDCFFVCGPERTTYLIDGGSSSEKNVAKYRILPFLKSRGISVLDYVFVSHGDKDHLSGIKEIIENHESNVRIKTMIFPVEKVWDPELYELAEKAQSAGIRTVTVTSGDRLKEGGKEKLSICCLSPGRNSLLKPGNEASMVLSLEVGRFRMLFTGDLEKMGEERMTDILKQEKNRYNVLKVAHHGSKNSSSEVFLDEIGGRYALISAGRDNLYGHPHKETVERLQEKGMKILSTSTEGAVTVRVYKDRYSVDSWWKQLN